VTAASRCLSFLAIAALASLVMGRASAQQLPVRDRPAGPSVGHGRIAGTVVSDEAAASPLRRVTVTLTPSGSRPRMTSTDDQGRFTFADLPAGTYTGLRATKPGFLPAEYGQKRLDAPGSSIGLVEDQELTIAVRMTRGGVIAGRVMDPAGQPVAQVNVQTLQLRMTNGVRAGTAAGGSFSTDDRGTYRIYGLPPGGYVVMASPLRGAVTADVMPITAEQFRWAQQVLHPAGGFMLGASISSIAPPPPPARPVTYAPVYYPGVTDIAGATVISLSAGQEQTGIEMTMALVATARIEGTIVTSDDQPPPAAQVSLVPIIDEKSDLLVGTSALFGSILSARAAAAGTFSIAGVRPGRYTIVARASSGHVAAPPSPVTGRSASADNAAPMWAMADVMVDGADLSGVVLKLEPGMTVSGRVVFESDVLQRPADLSRLNFRLGPARSASRINVAVNVPSPQVAADGSFTLQGVMPGNYLLLVTPPMTAPASSGSWIVKSAMFKGVDVLDVPLEVAAGQSVTDLVITFSDKAAEIAGAVTDAAGRPTAEYSVVLFSTNRAFWWPSSRRMKSAERTGADGKFSISGVIAGEYYLAALSDFNARDLNDHRLLENMAARAVTVRVAEGEKKIQDLKLAGGQ
jgi:hypothetical protein